MAESTIQIKGLAELHKAMQELPAKIEGNILRGALRAGAAVFTEEAKRLVPVDTGRLRDSIRASVRLRNGRVEGSVRAGGRTSKKIVKVLPNGRVRVTYLNPWYAHLVEFGASAHYIKATKAKALILRGNKRASSGFAKRWTSWVVEGVQHPGARAKPFLRPTFDGKAGAATDAIADYIRKRLPREIAKARR